MELSTFGAIMKFAMDREKEIGQILERMGRTETLSAFEDLSARIASDSKRSMRFLERTRRESVNEVVLEAITGLESSDYLFEGHPQRDLLPRESGEYVLSVLDRIIRFYTDAASRITNAEARRTFSRLAERKRKLRESIREYVSNLK